MPFILLILLLLLPLPAPAQACPCGEQFAWLRQKVEHNYAGYRDKVTPQTQADYDRHTLHYQALAAAAPSDAGCLRLLAEWVRWFRDGHLQLSGPGSAAADPAAIREQFAGREKIVLSEADARLYLQQQGRDPLEGIYQAADGNYRVALVRNPAPGRDFAAIVLQADSVWWMPGQVKFDLRQTARGQYTARYYMRDHSERNPVTVFQNGKLRFEGLGNWYRQFPGAPAAIDKPHFFSLQQLDSTTLLLTVPTMNEGVRHELDSLLQANRSLLGRTPNLIIDCRNNGGGSDITFLPLRPYVFSGPVREYGMQTLATDDNIEKYTRLRQDKNFPKKYRYALRFKIAKLRRNKGRLVGKCGEYTEKIKNISLTPRRVAILINSGCASSCEQFVYFANQSNRVTLIGQNTAGILDYGNLHFLDFPCGALRLAYPTSRSCRVDAGAGIDGVGIPPDLQLETGVPDWVDVARNFLNAH